MVGVPAIIGGEIDMETIANPVKFRRPQISGTGSATGRRPDATSLSTSEIQEMPRGSYEDSVWGGFAVMIQPFVKKNVRILRRGVE